MRPKRLSADGAEKGSGGHGGLLWESREKPQSEAGSSAAVRALGVGLEQGSQLSPCEAGAGWGGVAEAWLPLPLWPVLGSNPSTTTPYKLCDLQPIP